MTGTTRRRTALRFAVTRPRLTRKWGRTPFRLVANRHDVRPAPGRPDSTASHPRASRLAVCS
jgi:hypothetical protein